jgi:YVTN family beta-propeller protein
VVSLQRDSSADSVIAFSVIATDNIGLKSIHVDVTGGVNKTFDTTFTSAVTNITIPFSYPVAASVPRGTPVNVSAFAGDGAGNKSNTATLALTVGNLPPPDVKITSPVEGAFAVVGKSIQVSLSGNSRTKVRILGVTTSGTVPPGDSIVFSSPLKDDTSFKATLLIPANAPGGPLVLTPFLTDSAGIRTTGPAVTIIVQTAAQANSVPVVTFGITPRVELNDTIHVGATDPAGITALGYEIRQGALLKGYDSIPSTGQLTSIDTTFHLNSAILRLPFTTFPDTVFVQAFARNTLNTRAYAKRSNGSDRIDTVIVVAGATRALPTGGVVADAVYLAGTDGLYVTNIERNQVDILDLATLSFKPSVNVGSRPWGITVLPADRLGNATNTLLVANSGGTDISYVDVTASGGVESKRYQLPNIVAYTVTTAKTPDGVFFQQTTPYDFSDRPQYLGATCQSGVGNACGDVILVYSTTPTPGQSSPFTTRNGTLRWENLTKGTSHFFFEQAIGQATGRSDTLRIVRYDGNTGAQTVLVPDSAHITVDISKLGFRDTTFVRNSGNFQRAIIAEGGSVLGSRAMSYTVDGGIQNFQDTGISGAANVSDFVANTFQTISGVAVNFDGALSAIRGDSTYIINPQLRLQGLLQTKAGPGGVDFHPRNIGANVVPTTKRLAFAASTLPEIEIYDTYTYALVGTIPLRDPIIGPIRSACRNGTLVIVGATAKGLVITNLPATFIGTCP